ncbi:MAG: pilus assembly protein N-terminal domain-containing protein [Bryobacteraceae bacterium]|nr:pilus assembly protein N-terminal domain-containing protein [Solibacteraceae bacterium]MCL4844369.1 pilus assembly protein N-terminal domain-containing protein [Bryobacteraceae bacterium]MCO5352648.1 pilus assembly protein N-terminal domain-containing protein [Bryobacteraceae bacterium]
MTPTLSTSIIVLALLSAPFGGTIQGQEPREISVRAGKSLVIDSPVEIARVSVADPDVVEAVGITPKEVLLNGKKAGGTSVIVWQKPGGRLLFDVVVESAPDLKKEWVTRELEKEFGPGQVQVDPQGENVFLRGVVDDLAEAGRAEAIAAVLGKPVNLLRVTIPSDPEQQILLKVRFANVDRTALQQLGMNIISTGAANTIGQTTTGQFPAAQLGQAQQSNLGPFQLTDLLNIFLFRPDLNLATTLRLLQQRRLIEILAEPNVLAMNGKEASFLAGGEFPYPVVQGGGGALGVPAITIRFREFGVRLGFKPVLTSRGTIRLQVEPEVSALDFANGFTFQGFNIPALATRRVSTEIELEDRQSFAIAGLLDNRVTETLSRMPGLGDIPFLGRLFRSRSVEKNHSELLVIVTPEVVRPMDPAHPQPQIDFPAEFLSGGSTIAPRTPASELTGTPQRPPVMPIPVEVLKEEKRKEAEDAGRPRTLPDGAAGASERGASRFRSAPDRMQ